MAAPGHFSHVVLEVQDLQRSEQFFRDGVGLKYVGRDLWPEERPNTAFQTEEGQYLVLVETPEPRPSGPGVHTNFMLPTEDYWRARARLEELGCLVADFRAAQRSVGEVSQYFNDPDGHRLQMTALEPEAFRVPASGKGKIVAGRIEDFPVGSVTHNTEGKFFLVRLPEGFVALNQVCTHMHCDVGYQAEHYRFYCACHYNKFTRKGEHIGHTPGTPPLHAYPINFEDGSVVVDTDTTMPRSPEEARRVTPLPAEAEPAR